MKLPPEEMVANIAAEQLQEIGRQLAAAKRRMDELLRHVGTPTKCAGCGAGVVYLINMSGLLVPYNPDGAKHLTTCPTKDRYRQKKAGVKP